MNPSKRIGRISVFLIAALVFLFLPVASVAADITWPEEFYGDITINGMAAPAGTVIVASIDGVERGSFTTTGAGEYGGPETFDDRLIVAGVEDEVGEMITFRVNGALASQTAIYEPGESRELNLSAEAYPLGAGDIHIVKALDYLRGVQQANGSISGFNVSAWAVMAIAAAGEDPNTWTNGGGSIVDYLRDNAASNLDPNKPTDWERAILAIVAAGENPRAFGSVGNYVDVLLGFYDGTQIGVDDTMLNDDFWGILALVAVGESQMVIQNVKDFVVANQNGDGGWGWTVGGLSDADNTAAAVSALIASGESPFSTTITDALAYLKSQQQINGGFVSEGSTNAGVDSWVITAIDDAGQSPIGEAWRKSGNSPVGHLLSLQDVDGAFKWTATLRSNPEWMTAYAIPALLGKSYPRDTSPPVISNLYPASGEVVTTVSPAISASYADTVSGIDETSVIVRLDGVNVTAAASVTASGISYTTGVLTNGTHSVTVMVSDRCGNQASRSWSFQVASGGGGGSTTGGSLPEGTTDVSAIVSSNGTFTETVILQSEDGKCRLTIDEDTLGLTEGGQALDQISIIEMDEPPEPPDDSSIIGLVYDLEPDGATFDPPATLVFTYSASLIPEGVDEEDLVVALWDEGAGEWVELDGVVDPETNTITAEVSHFTAFTVLSYHRPATFTVSKLKITPPEIGLGEEVSVSLRIANTGDLAGSYELTLTMDGVVMETREVALDGGDSQQVSFSLTGYIYGKHTVEVGGLSGAFTVRRPLTEAAFTTSDLEISPTEVGVGQEVSIGAAVTNSGGLAAAYQVTLEINGVAEETREVTVAGGESQRVVFTVAKDVAGTYVVNVNGLSGSFVVVEAAESPAVPSSSLPPPAAVSWPILGGIVFGVVIIGLLIFLIVRRPTY